MVLGDAWQRNSLVMKMTSFRLRVLAQALPFLLIAPAVGLAQTPPSRTEATAALHTSANPGPVQFTRQQLDQMLAPIALYPDELVSQVLMAATYPQQMLDAAQWLQDPSHKNLNGDALTQALEPLPWEPSVKSLVAFPQIVTMMAEHIEWTQALGAAFAENQTTVMDRIQTLRHLAMKSGKLKSVKHLAVREEGSEIVIASAEPDRIYVPVYNPLVVYGGDWPDRDYPPVYLPPPQGFVAETIEPGIEVSAGYTVVRPLWGWSHPDWRDHRITVERSEYTRITHNAQISSDNVWHHSGPVASVQNLPHRGATSGPLPAGTIAPAAVAHQGQAGQTGSTTPNKAASAPGSNQPTENSAIGNKPGQSATTGRNTPAQTSGTTNAPEKSEATTNRPGRNEAERNRNESGQNAVERRQGTNAQPGQASGGNNPAENRTGTNAARPNAPAPSEATRQEERHRLDQGEGAGRGSEHRQAPAENEMRREPMPPGSGSSQEQPNRGREQEQSRPSAGQTPSPPPAAAPAPQAERRGPQHEQGGASIPQQAGRPNQPPAQGSSTPPAAATPQSPKAGGSPHEQKGGDNEQKNER